MPISDLHDHPRIGFHIRRRIVVRVNIDLYCTLSCRNHSVGLCRVEVRWQVSIDSDTERPIV